MTNVVLAHLYALRAHLEAVILAEEFAAGISREPPVEPGSCPTCNAPADAIVKMDTLDGTRKRRCASCGAEWTL